jgi:two-component system, OmpR family, alkaline phosphatase synthesis response regulator PhoP
MKKILIVEDEPNLAEGLKFNLEFEDFIIHICETAESALNIYQDYNMMILDIMLPKMNGLELLKKIRKKDYQFPVLILSAKSSEEDLINGLSAGADDYITKPFSLPELILRIKRILERQTWYFENSFDKEIFSFGDFWINFSTSEAKTTKGIKKLTQYEGCLMKYLIENSKKTVSREELLEKVWGYSKIPETRTVDIFIGRLRKLFENDRKKPKHIQSIRSIGYRFFK